jgi:hypothetical protein
MPASQAYSKHPTTNACNQSKCCENRLEEGVRHNYELEKVEIAFSLSQH